MLHGNDNLAMEDVWEIGKAIRMKYKGDELNMFDVLSIVGD